MMQFSDTDTETRRRPPHAYTNNPLDADIPAVDELTKWQVMTEMVMGAASFFTSLFAVLFAGFEASTNNWIEQQFPAALGIWGLAAVLGCELMGVVAISRAYYAWKKKDENAATMWGLAAIPMVVIALLQMAAFGLESAGGMTEAQAFAQMPGGLSLVAYTILRACVIYYVAALSTWTAKEVWLPKFVPLVTRVNGSSVMRARRKRSAAPQRSWERYAPEREPAYASPAHLNAFDMGDMPDLVSYEEDEPRSRRDTHSREELARSVWQPGMTAKELSRQAGISPATAGKYKAKFKAEHGAQHV